VKALGVAVLVVLAVGAVITWRPQPNVSPREVFGRGLLRTDPGVLPQSPDEYFSYVNQVLMIRDPAALESIADLASFEKLAGRAGSGPEIALDDLQLGSTIGDVLTPSWPTVNGMLSLSNAPFRPLAIAFRPDLAKYVCGKQHEGPNACGAEVHFDFGMFNVSKSPSEVEFQVIFEFATTSQTKTEFQNMVNEWSQMATSSDVAKSFREVWGKWNSKFPVARVRLAAAMNRIWSLRQYSFHNQKVKAAGRLPGEINRSKWQSQCVLTGTASWFLRTFEGDPNTADSVWVFAEPHPVISKIPLDFPPPCAAGQSYFRGWGGWTKCPSAEEWSKIRFALSMNTCVGCHSTVETGTQNVHVMNRNAGETSKLSPFLTGNQNGYGDPQLPTSALVVQDPSKCNPQSIQRPMNDLARRFAYVYAIRFMLKSSENNWTDKLNQLNVGIVSAH
jgi:hypothetical protein